MNICKDCIHYEICDEYVSPCESFPEVEGGCKCFKNAADVVEVRHGEWIDKPTGAYCRMQSWCSACGKHSGIGGIESNRHKPYCPNCGAKMDGERKDECESKK